MTRRWTHDVSAGWLMARQSVLTATDVSGLMPEYKRYLKRGEPDKIMPGFAALWASKHSPVDIDDTASPSPAAARGHIMEPWAVDSWNVQAKPYMYHWDDCVIYDNTKQLGFSPDAMNVMQLAGHPMVRTTSTNMCVENIIYPQPSDVMEIKSYDVPRHMKSIIADKMDHDELMQLAMAFCVLPKLERARLLWFCPDAPISMHTEVYTRDDLHDQIRWTMEIAEVYLKQAQLCEKLPHNLKAQCTEQQVWNAFVAEQAENSDFFTLKG